MAHPPPSLTIRLGYITYQEPQQMPLTLSQLERHLFKAADILRGTMINSMR